MIIRDMPALSRAINEESYEWLRDTMPDIAQAVAEEVNRGATPEQIRHFVMTQTQRPAAALRCKQAAAHLISLNGGDS